MSGAPEERPPPAGEETERERDRLLASRIVAGAGLAMLVATLAALAWLLGGR